MRILSITAGAGGMYCGSCLRDNALAAELITRGHDVLLVPTYTPTVTDEPNVSERRVFFGGVSVYLQQHSALFRNTPWMLDRLWDSPLAIKAAMRLSVSTDPRLLGELTISMLSGEEGVHGKEHGKLHHWLKRQPTPDVVNLPNSLLIGLAAPLKRALGRPIVCTLQGEDLFLEGLLEPYKSKALDLIRRRVQEVDAFVAVSHYYADFMKGYLSIPDSRMHVVPLGINLSQYEVRKRSTADTFTIGYFARVAPEKGLHNLVDAYRLLRSDGALPSSRLEVAGYMGPEHRAYLKEIRRRMAEWGLGSELRYHGVLDRASKIRFLQNLDVFSVPSTYREPKGIYLLEAMACGVPVVQPRHGAFPELLEQTGGGILVEPEDPQSLAEGILTLWREPSLRRSLGQKGSEAVHRVYGIDRMAVDMIAAYSSVLAPRGETAAMASSG